MCNEKINYYHILILNNNCDDNFDTLISEYYIQSNDNEKYIENFKITEFNLKNILKEINQKHSDNIMYIYLSMFIANKEERMQILKKYYNEVLDDFNEMLLELL